MDENVYLFSPPPHDSDPQLPPTLGLPRPSMADNAAVASSSASSWQRSAKMRQVQEGAP